MYSDGSHCRWSTRGPMAPRDGLTIQTRDMTLILRPLSRRPEFSACSDSSLINAPVSSVAMPDVAAASYGGFALFFPGSGAFAVECLSPRRLADSSAGSELIMASWAGKSIIAFRS